MNKRRRFKAKRRRVQRKHLRNAERAMSLPHWLRLRPITKEWLAALDSYGDGPSVIP